MSFNNGLVMIIFCFSSAACGPKKVSEPKKTIHQISKAEAVEIMEKYVAEVEVLARFSKSGFTRTESSKSLLLGNGECWRTVLLNYITGTSVILEVSLDGSHFAYQLTSAGFEPVFFRVR